MPASELTNPGPDGRPERMNYGPALQLGTFITPVNDPSEATVEFAQLSQPLGYDLVTFQDHPYQPALHDTWTLLSWIAGRTERIHLAANALNLPLRPPAVLARGAASLDLLSGGRFELALGAFWDLISAMGGERRTPGQSVEALSPERIEDAFPPRIVARLRDLKERLDPTNLFLDNVRVAPRVGSDSGQVGAVSHA